MSRVLALGLTLLVAMPPRRPLASGPRWSPASSRNSSRRNRHPLRPRRRKAGRRAADLRRGRRRVGVAGSNSSW